MRRLVALVAALAVLLAPAVEQVDAAGPACVYGSVTVEGANRWIWNECWNIEPCHRQRIGARFYSYAYGYKTTARGKWRHTNGAESVVTYNAADWLLLNQWRRVELRPACAGMATEAR